MKRIRCKICGRKLGLINGLHLKTHNITTSEYKKKFPNSKLFPDELLNKYKEHGKKTGKIVKERREKDQDYDKLFKIRLKNHGKRVQKIINEKRKDPEYDDWYKNKCQKTGRVGGIKSQKNIKKRKKEDKDYADSLEQSRKNGGLEGIRRKRKDSPYVFMGVPFDSPQEMECAKLLNKHFAWIPKDGVNCHIQMDGGEIDFKIEKELIKQKNDIFFEHHNYYNNYSKERRDILDRNGYKKNKLFVFNNPKKLITLLEKSKNGKD
jgi:ribosomal protein S14